MVPALSILLVFVLLALIATIVRSPEDELNAPAAPKRVPRRGPFGRKRPYLPILLGAGTSFALFSTLGMHGGISLATGGVIGCCAWILQRFLVSRRIQAFEFQLTEAIDLMVSTLRAGGGLTDALTGAMDETRRPLRYSLAELNDRIQLGENPEGILADLEERIPLESFRLFGFTLSTHWSGGGSLATTLSNVGRTIRDRVDVQRRVQSQAIETRVSAIFVLVITYGLALLGWVSYPERFELFANSELGAMFIAAAIAMQAFGLLWITLMTRIEV